MFNRENIMSDPKYKFIPAKDISAYELAQLLPYLITEWKNTNGPWVISHKEVADNVIEQIRGLDPDLVERHFSK